MENELQLQTLEPIAPVSSFDENKFMEGYRNACNESQKTFYSLYEQAVKDSFGRDSITMKDYDKVPDIMDLGPWDQNKLSCVSDGTVWVGVLPVQNVVDDTTNDDTTNKDSFGKNVLIGVGVAAAAAAITGIGYLIYKNIKSRKHR